MFEIVTLRMIENIYEASISLAAGLLLGILISWLYWRQKIRERETHIEELETDLIEKVENLNARAQEQGTNLERLNSESKQKEEQIKDLNAKIREKDDTITSHEEKVAELKKQKDERLAQIAATENNARELERTLAEKEQEVTTLSARINSMQDDLSTLDGIGPKVSTVLRLAGITSFSRLASTDIDKIREILEAENPNLLRLTDPSTWSEQARMAADGDWEALSALQNDLKNARRTREPSKEEDTP